MTEWEKLIRLYGWSIPYTWLPCSNVILTFVSTVNFEHIQFYIFLIPLTSLILSFLATKSLVFTENWLPWFLLKIFFISRSIPTGKYTQGNTLLNEKHTRGNFITNEKPIFLDDSQILKDAIIHSLKILIIVYLSFNSLLLGYWT